MRAPNYPYNVPKIRRHKIRLSYKRCKFHEYDRFHWLKLYQGIDKLKIGKYKLTIAMHYMQKPCTETGKQPHYTIMICFIIQI